MLFFIRVFIPAIAFMFLISSCSNSKDQPSDDPPLNITVLPESIDALASTEPAGVTKEANLDSVTPAAGYRGVSIQSMSTDVDAPLLVLHQFIDDEGTSIDRFVGYDLFNDAASILVEDIDRQASHAISKNGTTIAWLDTSTCNLWYQILQPLSDRQRINNLLSEFSCPRPPQLSAFGDKVWFNQAVGSYNVNGDLVYSGFDSDNYNIAIVTPASQTVIDLAQNAILTGDSELDVLSRTLVYQASSHDGNHLLFKAFFVPESYPAEGLPEYVVGSLLVNSISGELTLLNKNRYQRFYSQKVPVGVQDDATISSDGRIVWYVESVGITVEHEIAPSVLKRHDLVTGQTITINVPGFKESLSTNDDGSRVVFQLDGEVVVYRHDTADLLRTTTALNFCTDPADLGSCVFDDTRNVLDDPAMISGDGDTVLIRTILERPNVDTPQNTMELILLNVSQGTIQRVAPDRDVTWVAMTASAQHIVYLDELAEDGSYLSTPRLMIVNRSD